VKHSVLPFPIGLHQGELTLYVELDEGDVPGDAVTALAIAYERHPISEVLVSPATLTGERGRAFSLGLLQHWEIAIVGGLRDEAWPLVPSRVVLDVSSLFAAPLTDEDHFVADITTVSSKVPQPQELFAVVPPGGSISTRLLDILNAILAPEFGSTLYVVAAMQPAAVAASLRAERPWSIRPAEPIIAAAPAPAASPSG
jgi:hypothetical protein